jgi:hypothetical protein
MMNFINKFQRTYDPPNPNGQAISDNSSPVVLSTEQEEILTSIESNTSIIGITNSLLSSISGIVTLDNDTVVAGVPIMYTDGSGKGQNVTALDPLPTNVIGKNGAITNMTITNFSGLTNSATVGWQSDRVDNTTVLAKDYMIGVKCTMPAGAPANDKCIYLYAVAFWKDTGGAFIPSSQGTATLPTGSQGTTTIGTLHNLKFLGLLNHVVASSDIEDTFFLSSVFGTSMPDGWSIIAINYSGQTVTTAKVQYKALNTV